MAVQYALMTKAETRNDSIVEILDIGIVLIRGFNYPDLIDYINKMPK